MLNIVIPMAGRGARFLSAGYSAPKPLIDVGGRPMIEWVVENLRPYQDHRFIFLCLEEHLKSYPDLVPRLAKLCQKMEIVPVKTITQGAACTVLLAQALIENTCPLMIANSDQVVETSIDDYLNSQERQNWDGLIMTFQASDPKWSFCVKRGDLVTRVVEKEVVSNEATVGIYNFKCGVDFVQGANSMISKELRVNGEFYVAPVYNELISFGRKIGTYQLGAEGKPMHGLGVPVDLEEFKLSGYYQKRTLTKVNDENH